MSVPVAIAFAALAAPLTGCSAGGPARFPLREPMTHDADMRPFREPCKPDPKKPHHAICAPEEYESPFVWDGVNNMVFRPVSRFLAVDPAGESVDVNALDEVPDSSWFTNRIGIHRFTVDELTQGACDGPPLDSDVGDGAWEIDQGKENGANPGFRVKTPQGKFLLKADDPLQPERATGATSIATRLYHAAGYFTGCDSVVYVRRSVLKLKPGLTYSDNSGVTRAFGEKQLDKVLSGAPRRGELYRLVASKWLPGRTIGPFTYEGTRADDPNDVIPHEDRRELRGQRLLAAWLNHFDSREQNSMNTWVSSNPDDEDASPGYIKHWVIDLNDCFGSQWSWDLLTRRIGFSYYFDGGDIGQDFVTLGIPVRPWERVRRHPAGKIFGYFESEVFEPEGWKGGYQNPAFLRMSEHDGAWMARILARFTPDLVDAAVRVGQFSSPQAHAYLTQTLLVRQRKILARYFAKLSPVTDLEVKAGELCGVDLARRTAIYDASRFRYGAVVRTGQMLDHTEAAAVRVDADGGVCVPLPRIAEDGGVADDDPARYLVVDIANGASQSPLHAHLYDLGPSRGFRLVGVER